MTYWIDDRSESDNVIVFEETGLAVGSVDSDHLLAVAKQLHEKKTAIEVLGSDNIKFIPFAQIQSLVSRDTDQGVDIKYKTKSGVEADYLHFDSLKKKGEFVDLVDAVLPASLGKKVYDQPAWLAGLYPLLSFLMCMLVSYAFINKFRIPVYIVGGLWAAWSLYTLANRVKNPPTITRWNIKGRHIRKAVGGLKVAGSFAFVCAVVFGVAASIPDNHGSKALYAHMWEDDFSVADVSRLISNGADINYTDSDGESPLTIAMDWGDDELAIALIEAGADVKRQFQDMYPVEYAMNSSASNDVIDAMLAKGATVNFSIDGYTPVELALEYEDYELEAVFNKHLYAQSSHY